MLHRFTPGFVLLVLLLSVFSVSPTFAQQQSGEADVDTEQFEDWFVRCPETSSAQNRCEMTQLVNNPDNDKPILRVVMGYPPQIDTAAMIFILPLGTRLVPGLQLSVDNDEPRNFPFQICLQQGCRADLPVDDALVRKLRGGSKATVSLIGPGGDRIDLDVSLQGFTSADDRISP